MQTRKAADQSERRLSVWWILLIQAASALGFSVCAALTLFLGKWFHGVFVWALTPLFGAVSAYLAAQKGLNNYIAWIVPPLTELLGYFLVWNTLPQPGPVMVCALVTLFGAAAGHVKKTRAEKRS